MKRWSLTALLLGLALLLGGCPELQHPPQGSAGTTTALPQGNIVVLFESQPVARALPQATRVMITVYCATALTGLPLQFDMTTLDNPRLASLPTGYPLDITYDAFDISGNFIGRGIAAQTVLTAGQAPRVSVNVAAVTPGVTYVNPLNSLGQTGLVPITVNAIDPGTGAGVSNVLVATGNNAAASAYTDLTGQVVTAVAQPVDLHLFYNGNAVSVLGFSGNTITVPIGLDSKVTVQGTFNPVPVLPADVYTEIYVGDGETVSTVNQPLAGGGLYSRNVPAMIGPVGVTAVLHDNSALAIDPFPNMATPVVLTGPLDQVNANSVSLSFPATPTPKIQQSVDIVRPNQMPSASNYGVDVWWRNAAGAPIPVANRDPGLTSVVTTPRWNGYVFTPSLTPSETYRRHVLLNDAVNGGTTEIWEEQTTPLSFSPTVTPPDLPVLDPITASVTPLIGWQLPAGANPDLVSATVLQGSRRWTFYVLNPVGVTQIQVPPVSAGALAPLQSGGGATDVTVALLDWQPSMTWNPLNPDLLTYHWRPLDKATSAPATFSP